MSEGWQSCGECQGGWKTVERGALYYEDEAGNKLEIPQVRTVIDSVPCTTCLGTGQLHGGTR